MPRNTTKPTAGRRPHARKIKPKSVDSSAQQVYRHIPKIQLLEKMNRAGDPSTRKMQGRILELSPETVRAMGNITLNALNNKIPMTKKQKGELEKRMTQAKKLAARGGSLSEKRKIVQEGGFFPLLASIIPAAAGIIGSLINRG